MGTIYTFQTKLPLIYNEKIIHRRRRLKNNSTERAHGSFQNSPADVPLPSLIVGVCLVLAQDVSLFLNLRKQGYPCWGSPFFFFERSR